MMFGHKIMPKHSKTHDDIPIIIESALDIIAADIENLKKLPERNVYQTKAVIDIIKTLSSTYMQYRILLLEAKQSARRLADANKNQLETSDIVALQLTAAQNNDDE